MSGVVGEGARPLCWVSPFTGAHCTSGALDADPAKLSRHGGLYCLILTSHKMTSAVLSFSKAYTVTLASVTLRKGCPQEATGVWV